MIPEVAAVIVLWLITLAGFFVALWDQRQRRRIHERLVSALRERIAFEEERRRFWYGIALDLARRENDAKD